MLGMNFAMHTTIDTKLVLFGPSENLVTEDDDARNMASKLIENGIITTACINYVKDKPAESKLREMRIVLEPVGKIISDYIKDGYVPVTF
ncbi:hypothetical protein [Picrophilus oshimae]|nr:hypothetical protein [Picrophilus oshimae]AAT43853.1 hypothetical exported protein [Picrophilus oshimae DSM 9789]